MKRALLGALALAAAQAASAGVITVNGAFTATDWQVYFGSPAAPIDTLYLEYSATFDDALSYTADSSIVSVLNTNIPYGFDFSYGAGNGVFVLATNGSPVGCGHPQSSFCAFVYDFSTGVPAFVEQSPPGGGGWTAQTITAGAVVPEPPTWALLIAVGLAGAIVRRQRTAAA